MPNKKVVEKTERVGYVDKRKKTLINLREQHKEWVKRVVDLSVQAGTETNQTEIINTLVDIAMVEDPESFITKLAKMKLKVRLADLERRKLALIDEEEQLTQQIQQGGLTHVR